MKGGLAVHARAGRAPSPSRRVDVTYVFYAARGGRAPSSTGCGELFDERPDLLAGDVALLLRAHRRRASRPAARARCASASTLARRAGPHRPAVDGAQRHPPARPRARASRRPTRRAGRCSTGCEYREALQAVRVEGGVAGNVVPDRGRPSRSTTASRPTARRPRPRPTCARCSRRCSTPATSSRSSTWPPAPPPALDHPLLAALVERNDLAGARQARLDRRGALRRARASRPPTSVRAIRRSPTPRTSASSARPRAVRAACRAARPGPRLTVASRRGSSTPVARRLAGVSSTPIPRGAHHGRSRSASPPPTFDAEGPGRQRRVTLAELRRRQGRGAGLLPVHLHRRVRGRAVPASATTIASSRAPACRCWRCRATAATPRRMWAEQQGYNFPVLSDFWPHGEVAKAYGVFNDDARLRHPGHVPDRQATARSSTRSRTDDLGTARESGPLRGGARQAVARRAYRPDHRPPAGRNAPGWCADRSERRSTVTTRPKIVTSSGSNTIGSSAALAGISTTLVALAA